jgi:WD40 repeat protein
MNRTGVITLLLPVLAGVSSFAVPCLTHSLSAMHATSQSQIATQTGFHRRVLSLALSPDGKIVAGIGDVEDRIKFWDTTTGDPLRAPEDLTDGVYSLAFSPDGKLIAAGVATYGRRPEL